MFFSEFRTLYQLTGAVQHVVDPARDPDVTVLVPLGPVSRHVVASEPGEVGLLEPVLVPVDSSHDAWPWLFKGNITFCFAF